MKQASTARQLIQGISETLDCSQRVVANLLGLEPHTLSNNQEKALEDLTPRTRNRLTSLYYIIVTKLSPFRSQAIYDIIQAHVYPDLDDRMDSVISALQQDKYPLEVLVQMTDISLKGYQEKAAQKSIQIPNAKAISA